MSFCKSSLKTQKLTSVSFDEFSLKVQFVGPGEQAWKLLKIRNFKLESFHTLKMTGETPEVRSNKGNQEKTDRIIDIRDIIDIMDLIYNIDLIDTMDLIDR